MNPTFKRFLKTVARQTIGRMPPHASRLTGRLARDGGKPVRDTRFRPWANPHDHNLMSWLLRVRPAFRGIFRNGAEGLPQPLAKQFAQQWAEFCGCRYGLLLPHGTDALRIGLAAALDLDGLEFGGEVIVPNLSFLASATTVLDRRCGLVFVDVCPDTLLLDPERVEAAIVPGRTRAIMPVHLFGQPANMTALREIAQRYGLKIIEDAAQAHGAVWAEGAVGSLGDVGAFSFQSSKNLTCGEGGILTTNDGQIFERAYSMQDAGRARVGGERWLHPTLGWNCRPTEYQAAVLIERFRSFEQKQDRRRHNFFRLRELLADISCVEPLAIHPDVRKHGVHMFIVRYRPAQCGGLVISDFLKAVAAEGAPIGRAYAVTMSDQPAMKKLAVTRPDYIRVTPTPHAEQAAQEIMYIPQEVFLGNEGDMLEIAAAIRKVQRHYAPTPVTGLTSTTRTVDTPRQAEASLPPVAKPSNRLRFGIIGVGVMGRNHAAALMAHHSVSLAGITDANPEAKKAAREFGCQWFDSPHQMFDSRQIDAVVIATPHWQHAELATAALQSGLHVVCEKPLTVTVKQADELLRVAGGSRRVFAVVHQSRFERVYQQAKQILDSGELGPLLRCSMVETFWRSQSYYTSNSWRGTWKGEGGGVLLNQAPHVLDRYAWLCGMPELVGGRCDTLLHNIEVEDAASAVLRHANGAHGYLHVSTNECPQVAQTVITCDRGRIVIDNGSLRVTRLSDSLRESAVNPHPMGEVTGGTQEYAGGLVRSIPQLLELFFENVALAIAGQATLACPGNEGRNAVELANAIILSSATGQFVKLPIDREAYEQLIAEKSGVKDSPSLKTASPLTLPV